MSRCHNLRFLIDNVIWLISITLISVHKVDFIITNPQTQAMCFVCQLASLPATGLTRTRNLSSFSYRKVNVSYICNCFCSATVTGCDVSICPSSPFLCFFYIYIYIYIYMPWIFSGTIKENILFGEPFDKPWFDKVIECCSLVKVNNLFEFCIFYCTA